MSQLLIQQYFNELRDLQRVSGSHRESVIREAFKDLLKSWGRTLNLIFVPEHEYETPSHERRYVDGALLYELRVPFGYWEAKDQKDSLEDEIALKFRRGYPKDNIVFEDSRTAILYQNGQQVARCDMTDGAALERLLSLFFSWQRPEIAQFRKAVEQFRSDLPAVLDALRERIESAQARNATFRKAAAEFLDHARTTINPALTDADVREMLIQHILTEELFSKVFGEDDFHRENNIARRLYDLEATFFTGGVKRDTLRALDAYYTAIRAAAAQIASHHEKQTFLKVVYENFYKVYNPKAADRLGVVYTPNEIVRFMIESTDYLCEQHFGRRLIDHNVEILDPAAGTGTFIAELIEHFRGQLGKLRHKYREELHANEAAILPYYVANLNVEATYASIVGGYEEFPNLCFVDTLDNLGWKGAMADLFGAVSAENVARIRRQNERRISVIIGNPPYNANQKSENENNKNREYPVIDGRIRDTYVKASRAQKTKLYDMYVRFFRWASDRLNENGIIAFVSNSSFLHKPVFDGFRKQATQEFNDIWVIDLKGDARSAGEERRRQGGNIFGNQIRVGVAIYFCVRKKGETGCRVRVAEVRDYAKLEEKRDFLRTPLPERSFQDRKLDRRNSWTPLGESNFDTLPALAAKKTKTAAVTDQERAIFKLYSLGINTARDGWLYARCQDCLERKVREFIRVYDEVPSENAVYPDSIKWSRNLKRRSAAGRREAFNRKLVTLASYRPFARRWLYKSKLLIDEMGSADEMFPAGCENAAICFSDVGSRTSYCVLAVNGVADLHFGAAIDAYQQVPRYRFANGQRIDNITDWALRQFHSHYASTPNHTWLIRRFLNHRW